MTVFVVVDSEEMRVLSVHSSRAGAEAAKQQAIESDGLASEFVFVDEVVYKD